MERLWVAPARVPELGELLKAMATRRRPYHTAQDDELQKVSGSLHHEGVCLQMRPPPALDLEAALARLGTATPARVVVLEDVGNPHNVGAIVRVCAHYGVSFVVCLGQTPARVSPALARTAEGGCEHVALVPAPDSAATLDRLALAGFGLVATSHRGPTALHHAAVPPRVAWLLGSENRGLSPAVMARADATVRIEGTGWVRSMNVACAAVSVLGESWRQHAASPAPPSGAASAPVRKHPGRARQRAGRRA